MAGVFKSLDKSDIRVVPFRAHKQWVNDLSYTITPVPSQSLAAGEPLKFLQTNFSQSINLKNNYYYYVGASGNLFLVDGNDDFAVLAQTNNNPNIQPQYLSSAGENQNLIVYYDANAKMASQFAADLTNADVGSFAVPSTGYNNIAWIPGANMVLLSTNEDGGVPTNGLISVNMSGSTFVSSSDMNSGSPYNYIGTTFAARSGSSSNFFAAYVDQNALNELYFEYKNQSGSVLSTSTVDSLPTIEPTRTKDFVSNGNLSSLSAFATIRDGAGLWLISSSLAYVRYDYNVVRLLQDKDLYRNGSYNTARTFAVLENGYILTDLYANSSGFGWADSIDVQRWVGSGKIIGATINKNVDLLSTTEPLTITMYAAANPGGKGPITVFSVDLQTQEISDPIHLGYHSTETASPFLGDGGVRSVNFIGDNSVSKVVGLGYLADYINITTGNPYNEIYTFNI